MGVWDDKLLHASMPIHLGSNRRVHVLDFAWRSPESGDLQQDIRVIEKGDLILVQVKVMGIWDEKLLNASMPFGDVESNGLDLLRGVHILVPSSPGTCLHEFRPVNSTGVPRL